MARILVAILIIMVSPLATAAQERVFLQIAARPTLDQALQDLRPLSRSFDDIGGFRLRSGWYAIALGPYPRGVGETELAYLKSQGRIPSDSFIAFPGDFRRQFWPVGTNALSFSAPFATALSGQAPVNSTTAEDPQPAPVLEIADETPGQARASERRLDKEARQDLQRALAWFGHYGAAIDGDIGPGSRAAMSRWQAEQGLAETGILTTRQRADLLDLYSGELNALGLASVTDDSAGITVDMPKGQVTYAKTQAPFVHYEGSGENPARVILISQAGDRVRLRALFDVLQTLEIVPVKASAKFGRSGFEISGENEKQSTFITASLASDGIKGFALVWPKGLPGNAARIAAAMESSFVRNEETVLPEGAGSSNAQDVDLMAGLDIRRPDWVRSAIFIDGQGRAISIGQDLSTCGHLTLGDDIPATAQDLSGPGNLALIIPSEGAAPLDFARFSTGSAQIGANVFLSGFAYGGRLSEPSLATGRLADIKGLNGESEISRLELAHPNASVGGPVIDATGAVIGLAQPVADDLPKTVRTAVSGIEVVKALDSSGIQTQPSVSQDVIAPEDVALLAGDITAKLACWSQ